MPCFRFLAEIPTVLEGLPRLHREMRHPVALPVFEIVADLGTLRDFSEPSRQATVLETVYDANMSDGRGRGCWVPHVRPSGSADD